MSRKKESMTEPKKNGIPRNYIYAIGILVVIVIVIIASQTILKQPSAGANLPLPTTTPSDPFANAGALYSKSVDLATAGNYKEALDVADQALAQNVTSLMPLIQTNRAGILVMLGKNEDALVAADAALGVGGNLTTTHAYAWYSKGDALRALGKIAESDAAYANATALDPSLVHP